MLYKSKKSAFTLIELLVVIAIIGILATVSIISLSNARAKSRDAKRAGDIKQVQTALELFFNDNNRYPTATEWESGQIYSTSTTGTSTYMQVIPSAPTPNDGSCSANQNSISYNPSPDGSSYSISICLGNTTGTLTPGPKCLTPGGIIDRDCSCGDDIVDPRDSQVYPTVKIGGQCWLAKNMNIGTMIGSKLADDVTLQNQADDNSIEKYCYGYIDQDDAAEIATGTTNCGIYGGLYQWHEALQLPTTCTTPTAVDCAVLPTDPCCNFATPRQGICPIGWHVPTDTEFYILESYLTDVGQTCSASRSSVWDCNTAGDKLKEAGAAHWTTATSTNSSGFTALPAGTGSNAGAFINQLTNGIFWSSSVSGVNAQHRLLNSGHSDVLRRPFPRVYSYSVRCLRD